jgi:hypothetical protein
MTHAPHDGSPSPSGSARFLAEPPPPRFRAVEELASGVWRLASLPPYPSFASLSCGTFPPLRGGTRATRFS